MEDLGIQDELSSRPRLRKLTWLKYAAVFILIGGLAVSWFLAGRPTGASISDNAQIFKSTKRGEKLKLVLPDSSIVYLNASSKLRFPSRFPAGKIREIQLEGEAFFEVKHDTGRPFIVHSGQLQTRVLGTSFNVAAYPGSRISVAVRTGKVGVSEITNGQRKHLSLLTPGQQLTYDQAKDRYIIDQQRAADFNGWTENRFVFKAETLGYIVHVLERAYNISVKISNPKLLSCRFNATFANKSIREIADQLHTMSGNKIKYQFNTDKTVITLWGEACQ